MELEESNGIFSIPDGMSFDIFLVWQDTDEGSFLRAVMTSRDRAEKAVKALNYEKEFVGSRFARVTFEIEERLGNHLYAIKSARRMGSD